MKNFSNYTDYDKKDNLHFESKAVHGALGTEPLTGAVSMPIFQAVTYRHPALGESTGFAYSRLENPTRQELERTMAILEGGIKAFAFSSGQAANMAVFSLRSPHCLLPQQFRKVCRYVRQDILWSCVLQCQLPVLMDSGNMVFKMCYQPP